MLIVTVVADYPETYKANFFRRFAHCATLHAKLHDEKHVDFHTDCWRYLKTGDAAHIMKAVRALDLDSLSDLEALFESADRYTTIGDDLLDGERNPYSRSEQVTGWGYALLLLFTNLDKNSKSSQPYLGTKNNPIHYSRYKTEVVGNPAFPGFAQSRDDFVRYLRDHCKTFVAQMPDPTSADPTENRIPIRFSIDELLRFPIPIF